MQPHPVRTNHDTIDDITFWPIDIPMTDPFTVATGTRKTAENVFLRIMLRHGICGYGEAAPFPEVGGEDRLSCLDTLNRLVRPLIGRSIHDYREIAAGMAETASLQPAARCSLETALLDAYCRRQELPMWQYWDDGAIPRPYKTDITIPISTQEETLDLVTRWYHRGFRLFKMKVGQDVDRDVRRLEAVHRTFPDVTFIGDGNQGFTREECLMFVDGVTRFGGKIMLLEQPVARGDLDGMAAIRRITGIPIAADESVRSLADARTVVEQGAADYINIKIMKTGVFEAADIAVFARRAGLRLMIGGMLESRIAMGCSFSMVLGLTGFEVLDLDTPLLLSYDPVQGGYRYDGPTLHPWTEPGLGVSVSVPEDGSSTSTTNAHVPIL